MYQINRTENCLTKLKERTFIEWYFRERDHLQDWLARMPDALGEDLLVIQKEFDGFDYTRERLDFLALDRDGDLVVIEITAGRTLLAGSAAHRGHFGGTLPGRGSKHHLQIARYSPPAATLPQARSR